MSIELPYDYSHPKGDGTDIPNVPCEQGRALGKHLARFANVEAEYLRVAGKPVPQRCDDCAYRLGTVPNQCLPTVANALKCASEREPFFCHKNVVEGDAPNALCRGYLLLAGRGQVG